MNQRVGRVLFLSLVISWSLAYAGTSVADKYVEQAKAIKALGEQVTMLNARVKDLEGHNHQPGHVTPDTKKELET